MRRAVLTLNTAPSGSMLPASTAALVAISTAIALPNLAAFLLVDAGTAQPLAI
jgi:hypothetical protein